MERCGCVREDVFALFCFRACIIVCSDYFEEIRVFKAGVCLDTAAWNNGIGLASYFVGLEM